MRKATALIALLLFLQQLVNYPVLMNISLLFEYRNVGGAAVTAAALSLYGVSGCLVGFFFGKLFYRLKRFTLVVSFLIAALGAGILAFARLPAPLILGTVVMGMTSALLMPSAYSILGMYVPPSRSSLAISIVTGVSNLGGFASAYYLNLLGRALGEKLFSPIFILMGIYSLLAVLFLLYDPIPRKA